MFKSKEEFAKALVEGRKFKHDENIFWFDFETMTFKLNDTELSASWLLYHCVEEIIEPKWYDNIPKQGTLCRVNDNPNLKTSTIRLIEEYDPFCEFPFIMNCAGWKYATPLTLEEVKQYIWEFQK